jgi:hypothetical protein
MTNIPWLTEPEKQENLVPRKEKKNEYGKNGTI